MSITASCCKNHPFEGGSYAPANLIWDEEVPMCRPNCPCNRSYTEWEYLFESEREQILENARIDADFIARMEEPTTLEWSGGT